MKAQTHRTMLLIAALSIAATTLLQAAPSLPVTKPPVVPMNLTGPLQDPAATNGQWFLSLDGTEEFRPYEFYDNTIPEGGGSMQSLAIEGIVVGVQMDANNHISGFDINATIFNDTPSTEGQSWTGSNSHEEIRLAGDEPYIGTLFDTKLTAEFAIADPILLPNLFVHPYRDRQPYIIAENEEQHGWYCWNEELEQQGLQTGNYYVPTWDLGNIPINQSASELLQFTVNPPMPPSDLRYTAITNSFEFGQDIFANRTLSLKISTWIDDLGIDHPGPEGMLRDSDVSVFHHIEEEFEEEFDWGDAPDTGQGTGPGNYETLLTDNGAFHNIVAGAPYFDDGTQTDQPDPEPNGQPAPLADGDDNNGLKPDDEDGIVFMTPLIAGQNATVIITVAGGAGGGHVDAWIDFNQNGSWLDPNELIHSGPLPLGPNPIGFAVPIGSPPGQTYARFRINSGGALPPTGGAQDGEVEDHMVDIEEEILDEFDWGDIPDSPMVIPTYNTLNANNGANHLIVPGVMMGTVIDAELDGQPNAAATGDDLAGVPDDEDGVTFNTTLVPGQQAQIDVTVSVAGWLDVWLDADNSGDWSGPNDLIFSGPVVAGLNPLPILLPTGIIGGSNYMRFRYNTGSALPAGGGAPDGEVEDYAVHIESLDWGDAPAGFNTLAINNGANHTIVAGINMGPLIDAELNGQPTPPADGDDLATSPDEDGVAFMSPIIPGQLAQVNVTVSAAGWVNVWIDVDMTGTWTAPDAVWNGAVVSGVNALSISIPYNAIPGQSYMRVRYNTGTSLPSAGWAADGEVEDYFVMIEQPELDWGDAMDAPYPTWAPNGAHHIITTGVQLGSQIDAEPDGQPTPAADGDDANGLDDEDGVAFIGKTVAGSNATVTVVAGSSGGLLDAWIDFGNDGSFAGDHLWGGASQMLAPGANGLTFMVPKPSALGSVVARFRISSVGGLPPDNGGIPTPDGEVEDYTIDLYQPNPSSDIIITNLTFNGASTVATVEWTIESGITYQMESNTNLMTSTWIPAGGLVVAPLNSQTDNMSAETNKFYRVTVPWTP